EKIETLSKLSSQSKTELETAKAQIVVFGKVIHDTKSGEYKVTVSFQRLNSIKALVDSIRIKQGVIYDAGSREQAMQELVSKVCRSASRILIEVNNGREPNSGSAPPVNKNLNYLSGSLMVASPDGEQLFLSERNTKSILIFHPRSGRQ